MSLDIGAAAIARLYTRLPRKSMEILTPYLLFLGDEESSALAKTARGLAHWCPEACIGQLRIGGVGSDLGLPELTPAEASDLGARTMVVGVANVGGVIPEHWQSSVVDALRCGLDVASGLHARLRDLESVRTVAERYGRRLFDVRNPGRTFPVGTGERRAGKRLLTVGTDCSVGKMYSALAIDREMRRRGMSSNFRGTGQTGILIAGGGVSVDAVVSDFVSGAAEWLSPENDPDHWDVIEGQGSLFHPGYAGVTLGLIHGSQPDALVLCHRAGRERVHGFEKFGLPSLGECATRNVEAARLTNPKAECVGISVNTEGMSTAAAENLLDEIGRRLDLPCVDPIRTGVAALVDRLETS